VGIFGIGQLPTGSKDPFALRRASLGVLRILVEKNIDLNLRPTLDIAAALHSDLSASDTVTEQVLTYLIERFKSWYDEESIPVEVYMAVAAKNLDNPLDFHQRALAVNNFYQLPEATALAAANKRVSNLLHKIDTPLPDEASISLFESDVEHTLLSTLTTVTATVTPLLAQRNYRDAMQQMAQLKDPVDRFFDQVMVMAEDSAVRANRLCLLHLLRNLFLQVADISLLAPTK
jgi:glycyl-tRNA synthetase beta chain